MRGRSMVYQADFTGKVVVITGAGGALCSAMAKALAENGAKVAVLDIRHEAAQVVASEIIKGGGQAVAVASDVMDKVSVESACRAILEAFGTVDILINGAGGNREEATTSSSLSFFDIPSDAVKSVFNLNFLGTFIPCQVFGKVMAEKNNGLILNISSMNAFRPLTRIPAYSAAKAAVTNFTQWLAVHMSENYSKNIRVNAIAPGFFITNQNRFLLINNSGELTPRGQSIIDHTPMGRFGEPEDLIGTVLWILSDGARLVHGVVIPVDGGFSAFSGV